jgi:hypothetical protein
MECEGIFGSYSRDVQTFLVFVVAAVGAWIAYQQMQTARRKLRFDLFERRMKVFDATRNFCASILREGTMSREVERNFYLETMDAEFLFNEEISAYLETLRKQGLKLQLAENQLEWSQENREAAATRSTELIEWFYKELEGLRSRFRGFLQLFH